MKLVWCMIALVLTGADDPTPTKTAHLSSPPAVDSEKEVWPLTIDDAIRISLDNSEYIRVIRFGKESIPVGCFLPTDENKSPTTMAVDLANGFEAEKS